MDDFQHRLLVALERLAGRGGEPGLVDHVQGLELGLGDYGVVLGARLDGLVAVLVEIRDELAALRADLPGGGPGGPP